MGHIFKRCREKQYRLIMTVIMIIVENKCLRQYDVICVLIYQLTDDRLRTEGRVRLR